MKLKCKILFLLPALLILLLSCTEKQTSAEKKIKVMATIFPCYDWAKEVIGDSENVSLELLIKNGTDLHSYQPSAADIIKISTCDVFIHVGGESDKWVEEVLATSRNKNQTVINLMQILKTELKEEEIVEGMQQEENEFAEAAEDEAEFDEHIWLSLKNAAECTKKIAETFAEVDMANSWKYLENSESYIKELNSLKEKYAGSFEGKSIVVADRFPFRYLTEECSMKYYAAFSGCSAETEASFETIAFLSEKLKETESKVVFVTENSDEKIARTVIENSSQTAGTKIAKLDSLQSTKLDDSKNGKTYISAMKKNFMVLEEAF